MSMRERTERLYPLERLCRNSTELSFPAEDVGIFDRASPTSLP